MPLALVQPAPATSSAFDMAAEPSHRIANNLSMIAAVARLRAASVSKNPMMKGHEVRLILEEFAGRLDAVARLQGLLARAQQEAPVGIADYLRDIAEAVITSLSVAGKTALQFTSDRCCFLAPEEALSLGLIVNELVTNAVKYAHPTGVAGQIVVSCRRASGGSITVEISDDGIGLPESVDPMKNGGFGFRLVRLLMEWSGRAPVHSDCLGVQFLLRTPGSSDGLISTGRDFPC
jgi:two-component sensor histidine kinase